jgi:hypothetical protein
MCEIIGVTGEPDALAVILVAPHALGYRGIGSLAQTVTVE